MQFAGINYLAILVAAVAAWLGGAAYYTTLARVGRGAGKTVEQFHAEQEAKKGTPRRGPLRSRSCLSCDGLGARRHVGHLGAVTNRQRRHLGLFVWAGFVVTSMLVTTPSRTAHHAHFDRCRPLAAGHVLMGRGDRLDGSVIVISRRGCGFVERLIVLVFASAVGGMASSP